MDIQKKNSSKKSAEKGSVLSTDIILQQIQRIFASPEFKGTKGQRAFLQYIVSKTIEGKSSEIKGYTVATEVFGRKEDFDQNTDPIVSIQANYLRRALERYYLVAGKTDPIHIDIPKGTYVPVFTPKTEIETGSTLSGRSPTLSTADSWPSLLILPFKNLTGDPEKDFLGIGFSTELAVELSRFDEIKVLFPFAGQMDAAPADNARFALSGNVYQDETGLKITVHLIEIKAGKHIWGDTHRTNFDPLNFSSFQQRVVQTIVVKTTGESGVIPKIISLESKNKPPSELNTYEAILRYYEYDQTFTTESFMRALEALSHAAVVEPECSQVWSLLARLYVNIYSLDYPGFENPLERAIEYAERGVSLDPNNQRNVAILALVRFFSNELPAAQREVNRALELNPNSLYMKDGLAYLMILSGEWKRGTALAKKVIRLNPYYRPVVHYALWVDCLRQRKYEHAYLETMSLRRSTIFWYPLAKAATLGLLGRYEEGKKFVKDLLKFKPDFTNKGRMLIEHYIKFQEITERVVEGLNKSGLEIN